MNDTQRLAAALGDWLATHRPGARDIAVTHLRNPSQGYSNETWLCDASWQEDGGPRRNLPLVLRVQTTAVGTFPDCDLGKQYRCMTALQDRDIPVPRLFGFEPDAEPLGAPFFLMERVDGDVPNENPLYHLEGWLHDLDPADQAHHWLQGIDAIARLARIDPHACGLGFLAAADWHHDPLGQQLDYFRRHMDWAASLNRPYPHLQRAWAWLHAHRPAPEPGGLCWGDAKLGNCVFRNGRLAAMLDWEGCHLGSPVMDLSWWITIDRCLSEGYGVPRLPGLPGREASVARWEAASGLPATDLAYYEVFSAFKLASIMARIGTLFQQRGLLPEGFEMDIDNGAARVLAKFGELHGLGSAP